VKLKLTKRIPFLIAVGVIALVCLVQWAHFESLEELEARTYDWRVRMATKFSPVVSTNLGFVFISNDSIARVDDGSLGYRYGLYWPRHIYGRLLRELTAQKARAVGFDVIFGELRPDHAPIQVNHEMYPDLDPFLQKLHTRSSPTQIGVNTLVDSDDFLAWQLHSGSNAVIAADKGILPARLFRNEAFAMGDISADRDSDGVLRRARAFKIYRIWHPLFEQAASEFGLNLDQAVFKPGKVVLPRIANDGDPVEIPLAADGTFDPVDFAGPKAANIPRAKPYTERRVWHMGIVLASRELGLDLEAAQVDLAHGKITLTGGEGLKRVIPVDAEGYFYIDWQIPFTDPRLTKQPIENLLAEDNARADGETNSLDHTWRDKMVVVGSVASGNDLTDRGTTPLSKDTILVSKHWNVANSILTNSFIHRTSFAQDVLLIALLGTISAFMTARLRILLALLAVLTVAAAYVGLALMLYVQHRLWLPIFLPVVGALLVQHGCLVTWRVVFEQAERRRVRSVFSKIVAPDVVQELLAAENVSWGGARRDITVFFADVRGFTAFTDQNREWATEFVRSHKLEGPAAEAIFDQQAKEALDTVNAYLALVAHTIKEHGGTLDKYIGDCVMAFWGAPTPRPQHAVYCVRSAIDAQRAIARLNREREQVNLHREIENVARAASGEPILPRLPILSLGTGINTGPAIVGLMGSDAHGLNYTVFGREVNVASRLESLSGRGRIVIGEATYQALLRDDPALAATCIALPLANVKGIRESIQVYEVPWQQPGEVVPKTDTPDTAHKHDTSTPAPMPPSMKPF